eukprot:scaffold35968_cov112-Isochrysis_galbana.AAC.3
MGRFLRSAGRLFPNDSQLSQLLTSALLDAGAPPHLAKPITGLPHCEWRCSPSPTVTPPPPAAMTAPSPCASTSASKNESARYHGPWGDAWRDLQPDRAKTCRSRHGGPTRSGSSPRMATRSLSCPEASSPFNRRLSGRSPIQSPCPRTTLGGALALSTRLAARTSRRAQACCRTRTRHGRETTARPRARRPPPPVGKLAAGYLKGKELAPGRFVFGAGRRAAPLARGRPAGAARRRRSLSATRRLRGVWSRAGDG